jgi:cell division ATPase FtsA
MLFKKGKDEGVLKIALDIRSSSVGGALFIQKDGEVPFIKYSYRKDTYFEESQTNEEFIDRMMIVLNDVLDKIQSTGLVKITEELRSKKIDEVICVFASPWYKSQIKNFTIKRDEEVKFTNKLLKNLISQKKESVDINKKEELVIDDKILSVYMNGYEVEGPVGKSSKDIMVSFYTGILGKHTKELVEEKIKEKFTVEKINFTTHPVTIISTIKSKYQTLKDFLIVDISGEMTDIGLFKGSVLQNIVTIPRGIHYFVRKLQKDCSFDKNTALSHLNLIYDDKIHETCAPKSRTLVKRVEKEWLSEINDVVKDTWTNQVIPPTIFVTVDNNANELAKNILTSKEAYMKALTINREPIIYVMNTKNMKDLAEYDKNVTRDSLLSIIANYSSFLIE